VGKLDGKSILITSGPTRGLIDRVRFVSNRSSGRLGAAIGEAALAEGAKVTFIRGEGSAEPKGEGKSGGVKVLTVETVGDLRRVLGKLRGELFDAVVHAMAVLDYEPESFTDGKVRSGMEEWVIRLRRAPKVISEVREQWSSAVLVGFKLEVGTTDRELEERGVEFLKKAKCDVVVANDLERIEGDRHRACIIYRNGEMKRWEESKGLIGTALVEVLVALLKSH